jgi:hypothetical protein
MHDISTKVKKLEIRFIRFKKTLFFFFKPQ